MKPRQTVVVVAYLHDRMALDPALLIAAAVMTVVSFVFVGLVRALGRQKAYSIALASAVPRRPFQFC